MKTFSILLTWLLALISLALATSKGKILEDAAAAAGQQLYIGRRYAIYEYWPASNFQEQCIPGYSHVRLVIGDYHAIEGQGLDFDGRVYDMVKSGAPASSGSTRPVGGTTMPRIDHWTEQGRNSYIWAGPVRASEAVADTFGE